MVRRAGRQTPGRLARTRAQAEGILARETKKLIDRAQAAGVQEFAVRSMNSLAQAGPAWSGEFSASWGFAPAGRTPSTPGVTGGIYRYTKNDVPIRDVERYIRDGVTRFSILNTAPHADIAIDEERSVFRAIGTPVKEQEFGVGRPVPGYRYDINSVDTSDMTGRPSKGASRTAPQDWFEDYTQGGGLQRDLSTGFSIGFGTSSS